MTLQEKLIQFQNNAEKNFQEKKSHQNIIKYFFALIVFFSSTLIAGLSFPFRYIFKKIKSKKTEIIEIDSKNITEKLKTNDLIILNFTAQWCGPCMLMNGILDKFVDSQNKVSIGKINIDTNRGLTEKFNVRGVPQFLLIKNGQKIKRHVGPMTLKQLEEFYI